MKQKHKILTILLFLGVVVLTPFGDSSAQDGNTFKTVKIGNQTWMVENLNVSHFRNGEPIPEVKTDTAWNNAGSKHEPAWCYYDNNPSNGEIYGKLYNWYAVETGNLCPAGWHVPSDADWRTLTDFLGGEDMAGVKMKSTNGWIDNGNGNNECSFSGLPGGARSNLGLFHTIGKYCRLWSCTDYFVWSEYNAWLLSLGYEDGRVSRFGLPKLTGMSVRCLKDE